MTTQKADNGVDARDEALRMIARECDWLEADDVMDHERKICDILVKNGYMELVEDENGFEEYRVAVKHRV